MAKVPYEFLVRWNHVTGAYQGSHVKTYDNVSMREGDAESVAIGVATGYPIGEILSAVETGAVIAADEAIAARITAESALAAEQSAHTATSAKLAEALSIIDSLK